MWSFVMYSNCFEWSLSKEQAVINLSAVLLLIKGMFVFKTVYYTVSLYCN